MTWKDKLELGLKNDAPFRRDNLPANEVQGPEEASEPGRSPVVTDVREDRTAAGEQTLVNDNTEDNVGTGPQTSDPENEREGQHRDTRSHSS